MNKSKAVETKSRYILIVNKVVLLFLLGITLLVVSSDAKNLFTLLVYGYNIGVSNTVRVIIGFW